MKNNIKELNKENTEIIIKEILEAWSLNKAYIVSDIDHYDFVLYFIYRILKGRRISLGTKEMIIDGKVAMTDEFFIGAKKVRTGYFLHP